MMKRILIVEDDKFISTIFRMFLIELGHELIGRCEDGEQAVKLCRDLKPDVVLMDIHLSGDLDGIQTADKLRVLFDIPVIYISGDTTTDVIERAIVSNSYGFLVKPVNKKELGISIDLAFYKHKVDVEQQSREKGYREFISESPVPVIIVCNGRILYINLLALEQIMKTTYIEDVMGCDLLKFVVPDSVETMNRLLSVENEEDHRLINQLVVLRDIHGQQLYAEVSSASVRFNDSKAVQLIIRDISSSVLQRQQSELFQNLLLASDTPLVMLDKSFKLIIKNSAAVNLFPDLADVSTGEVVDSFKTAISPACMVGFDQYDFKVNIQTAVGSDIKLRCVGICDGHGTVCRWVITLA